MTETKIDTKILKALNKLFKDVGNTETPEEYCVMDKTNVCMITATSDEGKKLLKRYVDTSGFKKKEPTLTYEHSEPAVCKFSVEYLTAILKIFSYDNSIKLTMAKDYPLTIENKDFRVILAPRLENW